MARPKQYENMVKEEHKYPAPIKEWWGEDKVFPVQDWQYEVANNDTRLGYWEWVDNKRTGG